MTLRPLLLAAGLTLAGTLQAAETTVEFHKISAEGVGESIGTVTLRDTDMGMLIIPDLQGLEPAGAHGFHVHQNPDCGPAIKDGEMTAGVAAGGHYDPEDSGVHMGPYQTDGHLGDLPALIVDEDGSATVHLLAPRLQVEELMGRSIIIHQGGDNYRDEPKSLGGGGARIACAVVEIEA
ncbi:MAG: superoxide dismutase [Cu-Zn] SodC [Candidatus Competibacteraceae bacterium]|nr:superoxide dismutase [Cu-Zn] SodC [Candidatus Competibacteraceae bacterium]